MSPLRQAALVAFSGFLLALGAASGGGADFPVRAVEIQGARRVSPDAIRQVLRTKAGGDFDPARIREDVKAVYRMGYFSDVRIDAEAVEGGYRITVVVTEKPIVSAVAIDGNKEVEVSDLRQAMTLKERSLFQEEKVKESARKMVEVYQNKGFYDAVVDHRVTEEADGTIRVAFRIREGAKLKITRIGVAGNRYLSEKAIRKVMDTSEKGLLSFITDSGTFKKDALENDVRRIEALYQSKGFLDSKVSDPEIRRGPEGIEVTIRVFEGKQYRVGEVRFAGDSGIPEEELRRLVKLGKADVFDREVLIADLLALTTALNDRGYAQALVSPVIEKRTEYPLADVTYRMERGRVFRFGKVEVAGNAKTLDKVVRRDVDVADGATYSATGLKRSKENLARLGYFKDVKISTAPSASAPDEMDVRVEVQEGPTGTLSGGLGFSSLDKLFGVVQVSENNLFGRGWKATLNTQFGTQRRIFSLDFREPHLFDTDFSFLLGAYNTRTTYPDFERRSKGGRTGLGYRLTRDTSANVSLRLDQVLISQVTPAASALLQREFAKGWQATHAVGASVTRNTTNRFLDPSRGTVTSASVEYAGGVFGGDLDFFKYFLNGKVFYPVTESTVVSGNLLWGHAVSTAGGAVPLSERFFLGGPYSIRGFKSRSISPRDPVTGEAIGGNKELVANVEYLFPLFGEIGFKGVVFLDFGNTWGQDVFPWKGGDFKYGGGFGFRWYSPMGPLRFEWGWNLDPGPGEAKRVTEFTIGTAY